MLFLKRLFDQFEENISQITEELVKEGIPEAKAKEIAFSDPIEYGGSFFVPPRARWPELEKKSSDIGEAINKDPYVLEFLGIKQQQNFLEKDLEELLISRLQEFLFELGAGFAFVDCHKRITVDGDHYYIDLVFVENLKLQ